MERLTEKHGADVLYIGMYARRVEIAENASTMKVAATRDVLQRLAEYEDTGLTPEQVAQLLEENKPRIIITLPAAPISTRQLNFSKKPRGRGIK